MATPTNTTTTTTTTTTGTPDDLRNDGDENAGGGRGGAYASVGHTLFMTVFGGVFTLLLFYVLIELWPHPTPAMVYSPPAVATPSQDTTAANTTQQTASTDTTASTAPPAGSDTAAKQGGGGSPPPTAGNTGPAQQAARGGAPLPLRSGRFADGPQELECDSSLRKAWARTYAENPNAYVDPKCVRLFGVGFALWDEQRLLILVMLAGALGALLHMLRSFGWYVGQRMLKRSWLPRYLLLPTVGAIIGVIVYVVVRGGFFGSASSVRETSPFGFVAFAAILGLFSEQAILKLKQVSEIMLTTPKPGADSAAQQSGPPAAGGSGGGGAGNGNGGNGNGGDGGNGGNGNGNVNGGTPNAGAGDGQNGALTARRIDPTHVALTGTGFSNQSVVAVDGVELAPNDVVVADVQNLTITITPAQAQPGKTIKITVTNADRSTLETQLTL